LHELVAVDDALLSGGVEIGGCSPDSKVGFVACRVQYNEFIKTMRRAQRM
jgi:hypothetical protein